MTIDLSPIVQPLAALFLAAATTAIPVVTAAMLKRLGIANGADLASKINAAADAAAGEAYRQAVLHGHDLTVPAGQNAAVAIGANYVLSRLPDTLKQVGITPEAVDGLVSSRLGKLLAADPTISPTPAAAVPPLANDAAAALPAPAAAPAATQPTT